MLNYLNHSELIISNQREQLKLLLFDLSEFGLEKLRFGGFNNIGHKMFGYGRIFKYNFQSQPSLDPRNEYYINENIPFCNKIKVSYI